MRIFLSGPMGSGKSTLAGRVAQRLHLPALDLDTEIERRVGRAVTEIFEREGEAAFRTLERECIEALLEAHPDCVIALGGGTVTDTVLRRHLLGSGLLVTLEASVEELARRVGAAGAGRPLLAGQDVVARLTQLLVARAGAYAECHGQINTENQSVERQVEAVIALARQEPLVVPLAERSYRVHIGPGVRDRVADGSEPVGDLVVLVTDANVHELWSQKVERQLVASGRRVVPVVLEPGEAHKNLASVQRIWDAALDAGIDRNGWVIGVGGGVVGDLAGFAAATLLRGVRVGHVPTTLLAMVDSAVGGKTGFDTPHGKNLIGAFHQPSFVVCDTEVLQSLPVRERRAGLAEVVKAAWIEGESAVAELERDAAALAAGEPDAIVRAVRMSVRLKARIVTEDERESASRALLNLGHTVGHAIEAEQGYRGMLHGEAVALGMIAAWRLARALRAADASSAERMERLLVRLGLPTDLDAHLSPQTLRFVGSDKKRQGDSVRFVVPVVPGDIRLVPVPISELGELVLPSAG